MPVIAGIEKASKWLHKSRRIKLSKRDIKFRYIGHRKIHPGTCILQNRMTNTYTFDVPFAELDSPAFVKPF